MGDKSGRQDVEDPLPPVTGLLPGATERPLVGVDLDGLSDRQGRDDAARPTTSARATAGSKLSSAASGVEVELLDKEEFKFLNDATRHATLQLELEEVKSTLARQRNGGKYVPLRLFRGERLSVSVTDVVSRMWCELSMEYRHLHRQLSKTQGWREREEELGRPVQRRTPVMTTGTNIHLAKELEVHEKVVIERETKEDDFAIKILNTYSQLELIRSGEKPVEREITVFGDPFGLGVLLTGIIDQLQYSVGENELVLLDFKTRRQKCLPGPAQQRQHSLQLMLYKSLLDGMTGGLAPLHGALRYLSLDPSAPLTAGPLQLIQTLGLSGPLLDEDGETMLQRVADVVHGLILGLRLPPVSTMLVQYEHQSTSEEIGMEVVEYNGAWARAELQASMEYWSGDRPAKGVDVEDSWKCWSCQYKDVCVWRMRQNLLKSPAAMKNENKSNDNNKNT